MMEDNSIENTNKREADIIENAEVEREEREEKMEKYRLTEKAGRIQTMEEVKDI